MISRNDSIRLLTVPSYEIHEMKYHILINPHPSLLENYISEYSPYCDIRRISSDHIVHIFISDLKFNHLHSLSQFIDYCRKHSDRKVVVHITRDVSSISIMSLAMETRDSFKLIIDRSSTITRFKLPPFSWRSTSEDFIEISISHENYIANRISLDIDGNIVSSNPVKLVKMNEYKYISI